MPHPDSLAGAVTAQTMRHTLAGFPTGIAVVAAQVDAEIVGLSANSFTSVSLDPPLVSVSFARTSTSWPLLRRAKRWGISVLGEHRHDLLASLQRPARQRFEGLDIETTAEGAAFVAGSLATLTVEIDAEVTAGDHVLTLLRVIDLKRDDEQFPLVFFGSDTHRLSH